MARKHPAIVGECDPSKRQFAERIGGPDYLLKFQMPHGFKRHLDELCAKLELSPQFAVRFAIYRLLCDYKEYTDAQADQTG